MAGYKPCHLCVQSTTPLPVVPMLVFLWDLVRCRISSFKGTTENTRIKQGGPKHGKRISEYSRAGSSERRFENVRKDGDLDKAYGKCQTLHGACPYAGIQHRQQSEYECLVPKSWDCYGI